MTRGNKYLHFRLFVFKHPVFIYQFRYKINEWKLLLFSIYNLHVISCASHNWASNWGATMVHYWKIRLPRISPPVDAPWTLKFLLRFIKKIHFHLSWSLITSPNTLIACSRSSTSSSVLCLLCHTVSYTQTHRTIHRNNSDDEREVSYSSRVIALPA